jgi:hypothetical protein
MRLSSIFTLALIGTATALPELTPRARAPCVKGETDLCCTSGLLVNNVATGCDICEHFFLDSPPSQRLRMIESRILIPREQSPRKPRLATLIDQTISAAERKSST